MYKIATLNKISPVGLAEFTEGYEVGADLAVSDGALVRSADMHETALPESFLAVARAGAGVNNLPLDKMADAGVVAFNTPGANANAVKELVICSMLSAMRNTNDGIAWAKTLTTDVAKAVEDGKKAFVGHEIMGKTLGVIGLGAIGRLIANACLGLGMNVVGYDPYLNDNLRKALDPRIVPYENLEEMVGKCDILTIHVPAMDSTNGMISKDLIAKMKDGFIFLNYSRDKLVDESAMLEALAAGHAKKYVSDFPNDKVLNKPGVICTPHLGASTDEAEDNCAVMAAKEMMDYLENGNIINSVNFPRIDMGKKDSKRVLVLAKDVDDLAGKVSAAVKEQGVSFTNVVSGARGAYSAALVAVSGDVCPDCVKKAIPGATRVRVL